MLRTCMVRGRGLCGCWVQHLLVLCQRLDEPYQEVPGSDNETSRHLQLLPQVCRAGVARLLTGGVSAVVGRDMHKQLEG